VCPETSNYGWINFTGSRQQGFGLPRCIAFMRIVAAEADSFPKLAQHAYESSFRGAVEGVLEALVGPAGEGARDNGSAERSAIRFVEVALQPLSFQATFGADPKQIYSRADGMIEDAILLLKARGDLNSPD
ncbi:TetR/AcrR family transcriptional regulator C-terminal domain-containing protein, partial [Xanthomonas sp. fls2-241-TYG-148]|uniref:TetR/AcrR family transcriptional regulator C-terminal domain-containing protein n=1 Tax=Xanthomonas sp. fls2-241-TYG-148 TaxID=3040328 RepID=UPI002554C848